MRKFCASMLAAALAAGLFATAPAGADVVSTFDNDDEGWTVSGDAQDGSVTPDYHSTGGNPDGYISADDDVAGGTWYFDAPAKFLGNQAGAFGNTLSYDLRQSATSSPFNNEEIILAGNGTTLIYNHAHPGTDWTSFSVTLNDSAGWTIGTGGGAAATDSDIQNVLSDVTALRIRGEYRSGADTGSLDNVVLVPEPAAMAMLSLAGLALLMSRRRA